MNYYFITGTSSGIGKSLALEILSDENSFVFGISRSCTITHERYLHFSVDFSDLDAVKSFSFEELKNVESVSLVNNSGTLSEVKHVGNLDDDNIIEGLNVNFIAPAILSNKFIRQYAVLKTRKVILNISSGAGKNPIDGWSIYCSSKAALDMLSKVLKVEQDLDGGGFGVFAVSPGVVDTQMQTRIRSLSTRDFSRLNEFLNYKNSELLVEPELVSKKLFRILLYPENYKEVILSLRDL